MAERLAPYVYIEEAAAGPAAVQGVSTSNIGLVAGFDRGPSNSPQFVTSFQQAQTLFGGFNTDSVGMLAAYSFFANGGRQGYISRVVAADSVKAETPLVRVVTAEDTGVDGNGGTTYAVQTQYAPLLSAGSTRVYTKGVVATATLTAVAVGSTSNGETFELEDYVGTLKTFEFQTAEASITAGNIWVKRIASASAETMAEVIKNAINASGLLITATRAAGSDDVVLTQSARGTAGNTTITNASGITAPGAFTSGANDVEATETIDLTTGEITAVFGGAVASPTPIFVDYTAIAIEFQMKWEGAAGNGYRVDISGSRLFEDTALGQYDLFDVVVNLVSGATVSPVESFTELSFTDAAASNYVATVINDFLTGSDLIEVIVNVVGRPQQLGGTAQSENLVPNVPYNASQKLFSYQLGGRVWPSSVGIEFNFALTSAVGFSGSALYTGNFGDSVNESSLIITDGTLVAYDNGSGALVGDVTANAELNFVNYETGAYSVQFNANTGATVNAYFQNKVLLTDDGLEGVSLATANTSTFGLDVTGTNTIDYVSGEVVLTWSTAPAFGSGDNDFAPPSATYRPLSQQTAAFYSGPAEVDGIDSLVMVGGSNGSALTSNDFVGASAAAAGTGIYALNQTEDLLSLCVPDFDTDATTIAACLTYCQNRGDRFFVCAVPAGSNPQQALNFRRSTLNSDNSFGALYYPNLRVTDPATNKTIVMTPSAHIIGRYAYTDQSRNVAKAPAGTDSGALQYLIGLERTQTVGEVGLLDPAGVNCLVDWTQTGRVIWGCNTLAKSGDFRFVNQRRLFLFLEKSVFQSSFSYVFESNGPQLWSRLRLQITGFLNGLYQQNYFRGNTAAEAFFVICDANNNSATSNTVYIDVGVATQIPAKYVVFRFQQILQSQGT